MECATCATPLTAGARFCAACGTAVGSTCDACGTELPEAARFCPACGAAAVVGSTPSAQGEGRERKTATLLFADLVGFTNLHEEHDPERISEVVARAFERLAAEVQRYEGTVEKFAGDAILAVFGAPAAHEDDPERAVRAAFEMMGSLPEISGSADFEPGLALRIGIATGEVLVDHARASGERDLFVSGDAVNMAARLETAADPGAIIVDASTYAASREVVHYEELPRLRLKGKVAPVAAWRAVSVRARRGGRRAPLRLESAMVGRDHELTLLKDTVRRTVADRRTHLVTVLGAAGVGKSRLAWELEKYLDGLPEAYYWRKGRSLAYSGPSYGPIADIVKADARIQDDDAPAEAQRKLMARLDALGLAEVPTVRGALQAVLAIGDRRERATEELYEGWRHYLGALSADAPLVLVVEDIHWADDGVLDFIDFLARWGDGPLMILCLARRELLERRPAWGGGMPDSATIVLEPLGNDASMEMLERLIGGESLGTLRARITAMAEGNPLFAEEVVRVLVDRGALRSVDGRWELLQPVDALEIPDSVHAVLAARLDSLPQDEKRIAQDAAVVGRIFWDTLVAHLARTERAVTGDLIRRLRLKDLVVERRPSVLAEAIEFGFRHVLIRDVAYESLPKRDRSSLHQAIAAWAESELADRIDEFAELIASHVAAAVAFEEELESADGPELRGLRIRARDAAVRAGRRAMNLSQIGGAAAWFRLAIEQSERVGDGAVELATLTEEYSDAAWNSTDPAERARLLGMAVEALRSVTERTATVDQLMARLRSDLASARYDLGEVDDARALLRQGIEELSPGPPSPGRASLLSRLGWTYWRAGPVAESVPILERAVDEAQESGDDRTLRWAKHELGIGLAFVGRDEEAQALLEESMELSRASGDHSLLLRCYINVPATRSRIGGHPTEVVPITEEGLRLARRSAAPGPVCYIASNLSFEMLELGRLDDACSYIEESYNAAVASGDLFMQADKLVNRSTIERYRGRTAAAERVLREGLALAEVDELQRLTQWRYAVALSDWDARPAEAMASLEQTLREAEHSSVHEKDLAVRLARMAMRVDDGAMVVTAIDYRSRVRREDDGPRFRAELEWIHGLAAEDGGDAVARAASTLEELGYVLRAFEAWSDAAVLADRAGKESEASDRAAALAEPHGLHAVLGPTPPGR